MLYLGLGGKELSHDHASQTVYALNAINPNSVQMMSLAVKQNTGLGKKIEEGAFTILSEAEIIEEQRRLIQPLEGIHSHYGNSQSI